MPEIEIEQAPKPIKKADLRREIDKEADKIRERTTLPKSPGKEITDREWETWAKLLTDVMWESIVCYLYRRRPKIIRQLSDPNNKNFIDKIVKIIDIREYVRRMHGGGNYQMKVVASGPGERSVCNVNIDIPIDEAIPILNYDELDLNAPENVGYKGYLINKGIIDDKGKTMAQNTGGGQSITGADMVSMFDKFLKLTSEQQTQLMLSMKQQPNDGIGSKVGDILLAQMQQNDPNKMLTALASVKDLFGKQGGGMEAIIPLFVSMLQNTTTQTEHMLKMQAEQHKATIEMLKEMKTPRAEGESMMGNMKSAFELFEMIDGMRGGGGSRGPWEIGLDYAKEIGVPLVQAITQIYSMAKGVSGVAQPTGNNAVTPKSATPTGKQITTGDIARARAAEAAREKPAQYNGTPAPPTQVAEPQVEIVEPELDPTSQEIQGLLMQTGGIITAFMNNGQDGVDLAQSVVGMYGVATHAMIAKHGEERLFQEAKACAPLWDKLSIFGDEKVKAFLHEFVNYEQLLVDEDDEEEVVIETPPTRPGGRGGRKK